jgi:hypothetical protein
MAFSDGYSERVTRQMIARNIGYLNLTGGHGEEARAVEKECCGEHAGGD